MRIGILSAELDKESLEENEILTGEIENAGHEPVMVRYNDGKSYVDLKSRQFHALRNGDFYAFESPEVIIPRINESDRDSIFYGLLTLKALIAHGSLSVLRPDAIEEVKNKAKILYKLGEDGISTPWTLAPTSTRVRSSEDFLEQVEFDPESKVVLKHTHGTTGEGTIIQSDRMSAKGVLDANKEPLVLQKFIKTPSGEDWKYSDIRVITVGGIAVESFMRVASNDYRVNIYAESSDSKLVEYEATSEEKELAVKAAEVMDLEVAGVDIFQAPNGLLVNELNSSVGLATGKERQHRIARHLVNYALHKVESAA